MIPSSPADEARHEAGPTSAWTESWEMRLVDPGAGLAVTVAVVRRPAERRVSYLAAVIGRCRDTVSVIEHDVPEPRDGLELRASGIWADHVCESPFSHWSVGLEAFGLALDDPADAVHSGFGHRVAVGFDLEWEDDARPVSLGAEHGYLVAGRAHGEVLVRDEEIEVDGPGHRMHRWGTGPRLPSWWAAADSVAAGSPPGSPVVVVARAMADDHTGEVVEWLLERDGDLAPGAFRFSSVSGLAG